MFEQARAISEAAEDRANADLARQGIAFCYASMGQHAPAPTTSYGDGYGRCGCFRVHLCVCVLRDVCALRDRGCSVLAFPFSTQFYLILIKATKFQWAS